MTPRRPAWRQRAHPRDQRGAATAEAAVVLPLLVAVTVGLVWMLSLGVAQVRAVDAARETARAVARGDDPGLARDLGTRIGAPDTRLTVVADSGRVTVTATCEVEPPSGLFDWLGTVEVTATAVAAIENAP